MIMDRAANRRLARSPRLALDRASLRRIDQDGHLHVGSSVISAAQINPYFGSEIDDGRYGLEPDRMYKVLRDPEELAKAASSFAGKPVLISHKPQMAEAHDRDLVVGAVSNPVWSPPNLKAELSLWDGKAIKLVQDGSQCALSCGYRFDLDVRPGVYNGQRYDLRFINLRGNHVAMVPEGRVEGAMVGDASILNRNNGMSGSGDDLYTQLMNFLNDKLDPGDLAQVATMLGGDDTQVGDRMMVYGPRSTRRAGPDPRFPNANRLVRS
jgi:hypothetical protein